MIYQILDAPGGNVINIIEADEEFMIAHYQLGFYQLVPDPPPILKWLCDREAFLDRWTNEEMNVLEVASLDVPTDTDANRQVQANLRNELTRFRVAKFVNLQNDRVKTVVLKLCQVLKNKGIIGSAANRANQILTTPLTPNEEYRNG